MIARFSLLFLCKGYRYCQRCIGLIKALKLISKGTSVRLLLNIECYSGICLMLRVTKLCKGFFFLPEHIKWPVQDYPFQWFSACFLEPFGSITNKKTFEGNTFKFRLQFPVLNFTSFFSLSLISSTWELFNIFFDFVLHTSNLCKQLRIQCAEPGVLLSWDLLLLFSLSSATDLLQAMHFPFLPAMFL